MANLRYIRPNRLRQKALACNPPISWIWALIILTLSWFVPALGIGIVMWVLIKRANQHGQAERYLKGAQGEELALGSGMPGKGSLATLPDNYTVFNQVIAPLNNSTCELDYIVVGLNGVFAIEIKHHRGVITGNENDLYWQSHKTARNGHNTYATSARNPVAQVKRALFGLKQYLDEHDAATWVQGIVVYTHPDCALNTGDTSVPVLRLEQLADYIQNFKPQHSPRRLREAFHTIKALDEAELEPRPLRAAAA